MRPFYNFEITYLQKKDIDNVIQVVMESRGDSGNFIHLKGKLPHLEGDAFEIQDMEIHSTGSLTIRGQAQEKRGR